jgi:lipopolysaccharide transport system ATP-binding protein
VITVENLSKSYLVGHESADRDRYHSLRETMVRQAKNFSRKIVDMARGRQIVQGDEVEVFWALKDVSFEVKRGEVLGIIGKNGAGKSTLLKVLSRITEPTKGRITLRGRTASLLEVGTGFHPELTGRENIFLNGAILGMTRAEIRDRFDEIVEFAGMARFLDTPVKRYSSGMYVRLAFSVAAHLEPEILIIDEVLAVGDTEFQKKCLGKMEEVAGFGRTVIFVSHNMAAVSALCTKALVLKNGLIDFRPDSVSDAIAHYLASVADVATTRLCDRKDRQGEGRIRLVHIGTHSENGTTQDSLMSGQHVEFRIDFECRSDEQLGKVNFAVGIYAATGTFVTMLSNEIASALFENIGAKGTVSCHLEKLSLTPGTYVLNLAVLENNIMQDWIKEAAVIRVEIGDFFGTGKLTPDTHGGVLFEQRWRCVPNTKTNVARTSTHT